MTSLQKKNILITGLPGCGKSTLVIRISSRIDARARGFTTADIRSPRGTQEGSRPAREGFRITTLAGEEGVLARKGAPEGPRVGSYRVNLSDLDRLGAAEVEAGLADPATELIVIDEIARMELFSPRMRRAIEAALDSPKPLLATIQIRRDPFLDAIRSRADVLLLTLAPGTADEVEPIVVGELSRLLKR